MKYHKLVRDFIPTMIEQNGEIPKTRILNDVEFKQELDKKLLEEVREYLKEQNIEELADILEVIYALLDCHEIRFDELEKVRREKAKVRGAFKTKIYLESVSK